ncbi:MAG TPA: SpoIIE family protein phosphatase [Candidatus Paceibacterota bacterium]|nr:SpoIIE family protein phosphatase [Candidatus Paceibacterota bacterium]
MNTSATPVPAPMLAEFSAPELLNSLADGAYITDMNRRILFWNRAAERITGWSAAEVVGRTCHDNVLVHINKDGHALCGCEHCPLHRSMVTGQPSQGALLVYAQNKAGERIPVEVTVAPIRNNKGEVIGGIELFRDLTESMRDQLHAKKIQEIAVTCELPRDDSVSFETRYEPCDLVGGDFYRVDRFGATRYAILLADVMGHGVSAALCTMLLRSLWDDHRGELAMPTRFMKSVNERVRAVVQDGGYFGTGVCVNYDAATGKLHCVRAGHPAPLLFRANGTVESIGEINPALGMFPEAHFEESVTQLEPGDGLLLFTDGATELFNSKEEELGLEGLKRLIGEQAGGSPSPGFSLEKLEEQLLRFSDQIHLPDDLTLVKLLRRR